MLAIIGTIILGGTRDRNHKFFFSEMEKEGHAFNRDKGTLTPGKVCPSHNGANQKHVNAREYIRHQGCIYRRGGAESYRNLYYPVF